jgi:hypothetical protein
MVEKNARRGRRTVAEAAVKLLIIGDVNYDPSYQRDVVPGHKKIVAEYMPEALGVPLVGEREDGTLWCVDGRQRLTALAKLGKKHVRANVFASRGPEHEAEVFKRVNRDRTKLRPVELFNAMLSAGDEEAWGVKKVVEEFGFSIVKTKLNQAPHTTPETLAKQMGCVNSLLRVYRNGGEQSLRFVMTVLRDCWPDDPLKNRDKLVLGLHSFYRRREGSVDTERLVPRLNTTAPGRIFYTAQQGVGDITSNIADVVERAYKKRAGVR